MSFNRIIEMPKELLKRSMPHLEKKLQAKEQFKEGDYDLNDKPRPGSARKIDESEFIAAVEANLR